LDSAARRRYARQILLGEIGEAGQERLLAARFRPAAGADEDAYALAAEYLERAGCRPDARGDAVPVPDEEAVSRFAGSAELRAPAAAIMGAFAAVEQIKSLLGIGAQRSFPSNARLSSED
jgi:molybdopterin/thiamine biosynthesis adenylyltransferase